MNIARFSRQLSFFILILSFLLFLFTRTSSYREEKIENTVIIPIETVTPPEKEKIVLAFVGDIMLDRGVKFMTDKYFGGDYDQLLSKVQLILSPYDFLFANLEGPISSGGQDQGGIYSFRMEPQVISALKNSGFDSVSIANNHIFNWGTEALKNTMELLYNAGISYVGGGFSGQEAYSGRDFNIEGVKFTVLAFSEFTAGGVQSTSTDAGIAVISEENIKNFVSQAKSRSDLVVVSFHFGEEYKKIPNDYQKKYAELTIDSGADLIIGHHPHVVQTLERYKDSYIIYSLGNFIFDQYFSPETMTGGLLEVEVGTNSKKIERVSLKKVSLNKYYQIESIE